MKKTAQLLLLLLLSIAPLSAKEKLLDMNAFELVPPPKEDSFQKYQLNENIIFGTNLEKKAFKDGSGIYYRGTKISFELLQDDDFTVLQDLQLYPVEYFYFKISDDFGNSVYYKAKRSADEISGIQIFDNFDTKKVKLKIQKEGKKITFYINDQPIKVDDTAELAKLDRIQYIEQRMGSNHAFYNIYVFKD